MQPLEFTITIKPFSTGKSLSPLESAIDHSVFLSRGFIDPIQDFNQVLLHVLIPLIHGLPIWGLLNSLSWSNLSLRERAFLYGKAQSIIVSSYQEVSYSRLFEYQWFVVNHLFIRLLSESDLRWMSVGIRKSILWILHVLYLYNTGILYRFLYTGTGTGTGTGTANTTSTTSTTSTGVNYTATDIFCSKCLIYLCKFQMHAEFAEFSIRLVASLRVLHLYHHVSELIKLPRYEICPPTTTLFKTSIKSYYKY